MLRLNGIILNRNKCVNQPLRSLFKLFIYLDQDYKMARRTVENRRIRIRRIRFQDNIREIRFY